MTKQKKFPDIVLSTKPQRKRSPKQTANQLRLRGQGQMFLVRGALKSILRDVPLTEKEYNDISHIQLLVGCIIGEWKKNSDEAINNNLKKDCPF